MDQIIETIQISKYNTIENTAKKNLLDKKYTLDEPVFENSGVITIPCGDNEEEYFELSDVNFVYLLSDCPFNMLINNLVVINTKQFSFINPNKTITISIATNSQYDLKIDYVYGLLKCGDQSSAVNAIHRSNNVKWDRVLKKLILDTSNYTINDDKFPNYHKDEKLEKEHKCCCHHPTPPTPVPPPPRPLDLEFDNPNPPPLIRNLVDVPELDLDEGTQIEEEQPTNIEEMIPPPPPFLPPRDKLPPPLPPLRHLDRHSAVQKIKEIHEVVKNSNGKAKHLILKW